MSITLNNDSKTIEGVIHLPSSKSLSNRVLIIEALWNADLTTKNLSEAEDTMALKEALHTIENNKKKSSPINVGDAGTAMRFLTAFLANKEGEFVLTGSDRMKQRPIRALVQALKQMGARIEYINKEGYPPLKINGTKLNGGIINIEGDISSQYISAILLIAPYLEDNLTLHINNSIASKPYINMTIATMQHYGVKVNWKKNTITVAKGGYQVNNSILRTKKMEIESDWSAASYWYSMVAIAKNANVKLIGLKKNTVQGDVIVSDIYQLLGVNTVFLDDGVRLVKDPTFAPPKHPLTFDFKECPDLAQTIAVTCAALNISCTLTGLRTLRIKETDRIDALKNELSGNGFSVKIQDNDLIIGVAKNQKKKFRIKTYGDHRMAMAFSPLAMINSTEIENEQVVVKSYPNFWKDISKAGLVIK